LYANKAMAENTQTPEDALADAEKSRDRAVARYLARDPGTNLEQEEVDRRVIRRKTDAMSNAARRLPQPPQRNK